MVGGVFDTVPQLNLTIFLLSPTCSLIPRRAGNMTGVTEKVSFQEPRNLYSVPLICLDILIVRTQCKYTELSQ